MTEPRPQLSPLAPLSPRETFNWGAQGERGDRYSTEYGGPTASAAMQRFLRSQTGQQIAAGGSLQRQTTPERQGYASEDAAKRIGKTSIQLAPTVYAPTELGIVKPPPRSIGFAEGVIGGLVEAFTGALPGFLRDPLVRVAQLAGEVADVPLEAFGHVPITQLFGMEDTAGAFRLLPMTDEKASIKAQMEADPTNAQYYMAQYLRNHQGDYMAAKGLPQVLAGFLRPDATLVERLLTLLAVPQQVIARSAVGGFRAEDILEEEGTLHPALNEVRRRYLSGEFGPIGSQQALDRLTDEAVSAGFGFSNDPFIGMLADMVTDPIIIAGFGTGLAVKAVRVGALADRAANISRIARLAGKTDSGIEAAVTQVDDLLRTQGLRTGKFTDLKSADSTYRFAQEFEKIVGKGHDVIRRAEDELSPTKRGEVRIAPVIEAAARTSEILNSPFAMFGVDKVAGVVFKRWARTTGHGMFAGYDTAKVAGLYRAIEGAGGTIDALNESFGYALAHAQRSLIQNSLIKQLRTAIKGQNGKVTPADWMPDALTDPDKVIAAIMKDGKSADAQQMETFIRRVRVDFEPKLGTLTGEAREIEYKRQMDVFREQAAQQLAYAGEIDVVTARSIVKEADQDVLSAIYQAHWGRILKDVEAAKKADLAGAQQYVDTSIDAARQPGQPVGATTHEAAAKAIGEQSPIVRATIVGPRDLTLQQAEKLLKDLEAAKDEASALAIVNEAINTKEYLYQNVFQKVRVTTDADLIARTKLLLQDGIKNKRFVEVINPDELPANLKALRENAAKRGVNYEIGVAPAQEARWSPVIDPKSGHLIGYYPWMDHFASPETVSAPTRFDVLRERVWQPVRAENILQEARRKFVSTGVRRWGLDRSSSQELFDAIRKEASDHRTTMRAFSPDDFRRILDRTRITEDMKQRLGYRGLAELTARALESDVKMVGVTSKLTGRMKTHTAYYGNYIGMLSERIYPLIRFNLNPIFLIQEWIEPYFFNILRGVKLGVKYTDDDLAFHTLMDEWNMAAVLADGFEAREFLAHGSILAQQGMGPQTLVGRMAHRMPFSTVTDTKKHQYVALTKKQFGQNFHRSMDETFPGQWTIIQSFFNELDKKAGGKGNLSEGEVATRWYMNKGMYDPNNAATTINHYDGAIPDNMGRIPSIHTSYLAQHFGYDSGASMRAAVMDPLSGLDEWSVRHGLVQAGFTPAYAQRAWQVVSGISPEELYESIRVGYVAEGTVVPGTVVPPTVGAIAESHPGSGIYEVTLPGFASARIIRGSHGGRTVVRSLDGGWSNSYPTMKAAVADIARDWKLTADDLRAAGLGRYAPQAHVPPAPTVTPATVVPPTPAQIAERARQGEIAARQFQEWVELVSTMKGISPEEYVARKFTSQSVWLGSNARMPYNAYPQAARGLMEEAADLMGLSGWKWVEPDDPRYLATLDRAKELWPKSAHPTQQSHITKTADVVGRTSTEGLKGSVRGKTTITGVTLDSNLRMSADNAVGWTVEQRRTMADQEITGAGSWYPAIGPMFLGYFDSVSDAEILKFATTMNEVLSGQAPVSALGEAAPQRRAPDVEVDEEAAALADEEWDFYSEEMGAGTPDSVTLETGKVRSISGTPARDRNIVSRGADGQPNGFLKLDVDPVTDVVNGILVYVKPEARRQGIATRMYDEAEAQGLDVSKVSGLSTSDQGRAFVSARRAKAEQAGMVRAAERVQAAETLRPEATPTWQSSYDDLARKDLLTGLPDTAIEVSQGNWVYYDENGQAAAHAGVAYGRGVAFVSSSKKRAGYATKLYDRILEVRGTQFLDALGGTKMTPEGKAFVSSWLAKKQGAAAPVEGALPAIDLTDPEAMRQEVAARAIMAWGSTQIQTSPKGGFAFILRAMDENVRGRRPDAAEKYAFDIQTTQIRHMLLEFKDSLSILGLGAKLHDFIDSIQGNKTRTFMRNAYAPVLDEVTGKAVRRKVAVVDADGNPVLDAKGKPRMKSEVVTAPYRQTYVNHHGVEVDMEPAAMDIWMGRARGLVDKETINYLAERVAREKGITRKQAQLQVQQELNIWIGEPPKGSGGQKAWSGSPTPEEYEAMLLYYNRLKDHLNEMEDGQGWLGQQWSVADIQAVEWVRVQKALGIEAGGPTNMFGAHATSVHAEWNPGKHMALADLGLERLSESQRDYVIRTVDMEIRGIIAEETGVTFVRHMPGWQNTTDGVVSANSTFTIIGHPGQIADALHMYSMLTQQHRVMGLRSPTLKGIPKAGAGKQWGLEFIPDPAVADHVTMELLRIWLNGEARSTNAFHGEGTVNLMRPDATGSLAVLYPKAKGVQADFETHAPLPDDMAARLADGTWIRDLRPDADPVKVTTERRLHGVVEVKNDYAADAIRADKMIRDGADADTTMAAEMGKAVQAKITKGGRDDIRRRVVDQHLPSIRAVADDAARRAAGETWAAGRGRLEFLSEGGGGTRTYYQRDARGWRGATQFNRRRNTSNAVATGSLGGSRGGLLFRTGRADVTTPVHEFFHFFADDLDESAIERIHTVWWDSLTPRQQSSRTQPAAHTVLEREAEEWLSHHFEEYTATGLVPDLDPTLNAVFNAYADAWKVMHGKTPNVKPEVAALFGGMTREMHRGPSATFHVDHFRMMEAARIALQRAEEEAFRTHFYKRGRSVLERSINHPYLGLYPASYMWGKVLPELMRFLVKKPFGIDAPFAGMAMANHVWNAMQLEMNTDDGALKNLVAEFPELLRFLQLMIPGTPWDIPVNAPAWARRLSQGAWEGKPADVGAAISDTISYAFGPGRAPADIFQWLQDFQGAGEKVGQMLSGTYVNAEDRKIAEAQLKDQQRQGITPMDEPVPPRLQYGEQPVQ